MNSIFRKTLIATALSTILSTAAIAAEDYQETIDGDTTSQRLNSQQDESLNNRSASDMDKQDFQKTIDGDTPDRKHNKSSMNDMNDSNMRHNNHNQTDGNHPCNDDMEKYDADDRPLTDHQGNVTNQNSNTNSTSQSKNRDMDQRDAEDRPLTDHQDNVIEEEEEEEDFMPRVKNDRDKDTEIDYSDDTKKMEYSGETEMKVQNDSEMNVQMEEASDSRNKNNANTSSASNLYSMPADELLGMTVVANDDEEIGYLSSIVLSPDQSEVHAVIKVGSTLGMGGRDIMASLDELTLVNDKLHIQMEEASSSNNTDQAVTSTASNLYSMSADDLLGMTVVANDDEDIGYLSSIVLSPDQSEVHAVITVDSFLGMGGRDILVSLDELTLVNDELHINANEDDIEAMNDYGSDDFVELEGDAALSTAIRVK